MSSREGVTDATAALCKRSLRPESHQVSHHVDVHVHVRGMGGGGLGDRLPLGLVGARSPFSNKTALSPKTKSRFSYD